MTDLTHTRRKNIRKAKKALGAIQTTWNGAAETKYPDFAWLIMRLQKTFKGVDLQLRIFERKQQIQDVSGVSRFRQISIYFTLGGLISALRFPVEIEDDLGFLAPIDSTSKEGRDKIYENCVEILSPIYEKALSQ